MTAVPMHTSPHCVICAGMLDPGARKCVKCGAYQDGRHCNACGLTIPAEATVCHSCKVLLNGSTCRACGETIETGARRCPSCQSWQRGLRRIIPASEVTLALVLSIISVIGAIATPVSGILGNRSKTSIRVLGDEPYKPEGAAVPEDTIQVRVMNTGKRNAEYLSATITFDEHTGAAETKLELMNKKDVVIKPGEHLYLYFTATVEHPDKKKADVLKEAAEPKRFGTVTIMIAETDWRDNVLDKPRRHPFALSTIPQWMKNHVKSD
jgi:hypothetical protein